MRNNHPPLAAKNGANTSDSTAISLIKMFRDGPDVSFKGSPTVSPITAALWASDPLGPSDFACSEFPACNTKRPTHQESCLPNLPSSNNYFQHKTPPHPAKRYSRHEVRHCHLHHFKCVKDSLPRCTSWRYPRHLRCWMQRWQSATDNSQVRYCRLTYRRLTPGNITSVPSTSNWNLLPPMGQGHTIAGQ